MGSYDPWLVALSVILAIGASYAALDMSSRTAASRGTTRRLWLSGGALSMGAGIWSMHYVGMLAFRLPVPVFYHMPRVAVSLCAAIFASAAALFVVSRRTMRMRALLGGGLVIGFGISAMHYVGMSAMRMSASVFLDTRIVLLSVAIAVLVSMVALWLTFKLRTDTRELAPAKIASASVMGLAITSMHYTGMAAASLHATSNAVDQLHTVNVTSLGVVGIAFVTFLVLILAMVASTLNRRFNAQRDVFVDGAIRHRNLIERSAAGMFWSSATGRITDCNEACALILGFASRETMLRHDTAQLRTDDATRARFNAALESGEPLTDFECWLKQPGKASVCVLVNAILLKEADGSRLVEGTMVNITARKLVENELRAI